jgi:TetR/AcrR family transcriptional regulator, ethionamide resistance regulator
VRNGAAEALGTLAPVASARSSQAAPTPKRAAVQAAVLRATEQLLAEGRSYADLRIERIARRAGISRTAFYFYFRDKRELLLRLTEDVSERLFEQADIWFSGDGEPEAELRAALTNIAAEYREHGVLLAAIVEVSTYDEEFAALWRTIVGRFVEATEKRIERERAHGRAAPGDGRATAFALCWMTERALYQQFVQEEPLPPAALVEAQVGIWLRAVYGA